MAQPIQTQKEIRTNHHANNSRWPTSGNIDNRIKMPTPTKLATIDPDENAAYGDNMEQKQAGLTRFYFINTNGISHYRELLDFYKILQSMRDNEIDVFGFSETNLDS
jgi:hypothetical protein